MPIRHWSCDRFWTDALNEFHRRNQWSEFTISIDMKRLEKVVYSSDGPAYKLMEGMCSVNEHEGYDGYKGAPRLLLAILTELDQSGESVVAVSGGQIPKSIIQMQSESPMIRRAVRLLQMVSELHKAGYQRIRIAAGSASPDSYWDCRITTVENTQSNGWEPINLDRDVAFYSTCQENEYFEWFDAAGKSARQLAQLFIERFPDIARAGVGIDYEYVGWFQTILGDAEQGNLPCFSNDLKLDNSYLPSCLKK